MRIQLLVTLAVVVFLFSCGGRTHVIPVKGNSTLGQTAYAQHCASCHPDPTVHEDDGPEEIRDALRSVPAMQPIQLSADDLANIVAYLATVEPTHTPDPAEGLTLWNSNCASCHSNASTFADFTVAQLQTALGTAPMTGIALTPDQFADIAAYLGTLSPTGNAANGQTYFTATCSGCHTATALAQKTAANIQTALSAVSAMSGLSPTQQQILDLAAYFAAVSPGGNAANGQTFFAAHCTGCHTPASMSGRSAAQLQAALALSPMTSITATSQDILDLVAYLATT